MTALFNLGFRPFFLGATWFAVVSMALWMAVYRFHYPLALDGISASQWHAHEMLYGYAIAVIAGFLLTSIRNWTGLATLTGLPLALAFGLWLAARLMMLLGTDALVLAACADLLFMLVLIVACAVPILRVRQWRQMAILSKLLMLGIGNALFYAGALGLHEDGLRWSLYGGLYLVIALILTMARRVIPSFTERGIEPPVQLRNSRFLDFSSLILLLVFWIAEVFLQQHAVAAACSAAMFVVNAIRLAFWYRPGIWKKPLLWSLFTAFALIDAGFLLFALSAVLPIAVTLAVHAFAVGGIALITLAMMARVALGHTGRSVHQAPAVIILPMTLLLLAFMTRVVGPLVAPLHHGVWVMLSQVCWISAFTVFGVAWFPILTRPRIDGAPG
ncbi:MAG: NnrS family protein [Gammaproteobacteria bacterium]|jgi:uncharacterized protein involved in response to NO|nr:NnrS family protein [Gammaproteobacteria bacterium]MBP6053409.1 NnrS family protein [Pseudomonadales bacterium]MBK6585186.1 NnrS family protein [Gammaproteobacteria bacterium]MBK7169063.1 NnrS family protein [Gammaproteobacteria bacterium]MBK7520091.1 NnrS family protein [Gammaproteobacteria bacterium]